MLKIHTHVNMKYETHTFAYRYFNDLAHYNDKLKGSKIASALDVTYTSAIQTFETIEANHPLLVDAIRLYHKLRNVFVAFPFFDLDISDVNSNQVKEKILETTRMSFEVLDSKSYDHHSMYELVNHAEIDDAMKWRLLSMYEQSKEIYDAYKHAMVQLTPFIEKLVIAQQEAIDAFIEPWTELNIKGDLEVSKYFGITLAENNFDMYPSVVGINQGTFYKDYIFLGLSLTPGYKTQIPMTLVRAIEVSKMLSDPTKGSILALLKEKTMYGKELATALNLSAATVSYHIQELLQNACITMEQTEGTNRTYYSIHKDTIQEALSVLKDEYR